MEAAMGHLRDAKGELILEERAAGPAAGCTHLGGFRC